MHDGMTSLALVAKRQTLYNTASCNIKDSYTELADYQKIEIILEMKVEGKVY